MKSFIQEINLSTGPLLLSGLVGLSGGLSLYNFLLIRIYPASSKRVLLLTAAACLVVALAYMLILDRWLAPAWRQASTRQRWILALGGTLISLYLLFTGTSAWLSAPEVIPFLDPNQSLEIKVPIEGQSSEADITILYFSTSAGDVSFDNVGTRGWEKTDAGWHLVDLQDNYFQWSGKTGGKATVVFAGSARGTQVDLIWNGDSQLIDLGRGGSKVFVNSQFTIPPYAGRWVILLLSLAVLNGIVLPVFFGIWNARNVIAQAVHNAIKPISHPLKEKEFQKWIFMFILTLLALILRMVWLDREVFYIDELNHMAAAKAIANGAAWSAVYQRSLVIVTLPVALFIRLFGAEMWAARLPGILVNSLAIVPLFLILNKVNRTGAVLGTLLFATNPWLIGVARTVREYAYYPFIFYWIIYAMIGLLQQIPQGFVLLRDWKQLIHIRIIALTLLLLLALGYAAFDNESTFKIIGIAYLVFLVFLMSRLDFRNKTNVVLAVGTTGVILILAGLYVSQQFGFGWAGFNLYPLQYFLPNPPQQIYFGRPALLFSVALLASLGLAILFFRKNYIPAFLASLLFLFGLLEVLFWGTYYRPRYFMSMQFWFLPLLGVGLWAAWVVFRKATDLKPSAAGAAASLLLALSINPTQTLTAVYAEQSGTPTQVTGEFQYDMDSIDRALSNQMIPGDLLISNFYGRYVAWRGHPEMEIRIPPENLALNSQSEALRKYVSALVEIHASGWIILEGWTTWSGLPREDFSLAGKHIQYLGQVAGEMIWKWEASH